MSKQMLITSLNIVEKKLEKNVENLMQLHELSLLPENIWNYSTHIVNRIGDFFDIMQSEKSKHITSSERKNLNEYMLLFGVDMIYLIGLLQSSIKDYSCSEDFSEHHTSLNKIVDNFSEINRMTIRIVENLK